MYIYLHIFIFVNQSTNFSIGLHKSNWINLFCCIWVAPPRLFTLPQVNCRGRATRMQAKRIKLDLGFTSAKFLLVHYYDAKIKNSLIKLSDKPQKSAGRYGLPWLKDILVWQNCNIEIYRNSELPPLDIGFPIAGNRYVGWHIDIG